MRGKNLINVLVKKILSIQFFPFPVFWKSVFIITSFLFTASITSYGQCDGYMYVYSSGGCGNSKTLQVYEDYGYSSYFIWYKKTSSGYWQYLGESPSDYGSGSFSVYVTSTTTFGVSYFNDNYWCESPKEEIVVSPSSPPYASGYGYSCEYGTAYIQAQGSTGMSSYTLYRYENGSYQYVQSSSSGSFTINNFYVDDPNYTSNYYVRGSRYGCWSGYSNVYIDVMRPAMPTVTGNTNPCYNTSTTLTASGGYEGGYRWYQGANLIPGATGSQYTTGALTASTAYYVSYIVDGYYGQCESPKRYVSVTVRNPAPPVPYAKSRCGPGNVTLSTNNSGFSEYQWYNQSGTLLGSTTVNSFTVSTAGLTSYSVKVRDSYGCWSGMSSSASVTTTHNYPPDVYQGTACGPGTQVTMYASYYGERSGDYYIEWYTSETATYPEHSVTVSQYENDASYSIYLSGNKEYWVQAYDPGTSYDCRTERTHFTATVGSPPYAWATGYSCEYNTAYVQAQSSSTISTYYLYRYEDTGFGSTYNLIQSNSTGSFTINDFYSDDTQYTSNYYVRGRSNIGCYSSYSNVDIEVMRPPMPTVTGNTNPCYNTSTTLTASGGYEGGYRWYQGANLIPGATGSAYNTGVLTTSTTYSVSYIVEGYYGQCESPKRYVPVTVRNPSAPTPNNTTRCGPGDVILSASSGFSKYSWYDQNGSLLGSGTPRTLTVPAEGLTSYTVKVEDSYGCPSGMSSSATVTTTHNQPPEVYQAPACGPNSQVTMHATHYGERTGDYYIEWYTTETGTYPEYSATVSQYENSASYSPNLSANKQYWVAVYDPGTSFECRTERTPFTATVGTAPYVWGSGYSCENYSAYIESGGSPNLTIYHLYRYEDTGSGLTYNFLQSNSTGIFTVTDFYSEGTQYTSNYYVRAKSNLGCWTGYSIIDIEVMRLQWPTVTGTSDVCDGKSTVLTASGGYEGAYRWYENSTLILGETASVYSTGPLTNPDTYYDVLYVEQGMNGGQCESPKRRVNIDILSLPGKPSSVNADVKRCGPGIASFQAVGDFSNFQWYDANENPIVGATSSDYSFQLDDLDVEKIYKVTGISSDGCESESTEMKAIAVSNCENYLHEELIRVKDITSEGQIAALTVDQKTDTWNYFDGLGRPMQKVVEQVSPLGHDIVQPVVYDQFGREKITYLPYAATSGDFGKYRTSALTDQAAFYQTADHIDHDSHPWAEKVFELSPLNRELEKGAPGEGWQPGTGHTVKLQYLVNDASENVFNWRYDHTSGTIVKDANYGTGQLYVNVTIDEEENAVREYKDKQGRIVLKKVQVVQTPGTGHAGWLCTYYVYDDFNNLKAVIPPQAVAEMDDANNYGLVNNALFSKNWLFIYKYDHRQRMIEKQVPGAEPVYMVYDKRDRIVLTQDGNQRVNNVWLFSKYDALNRIVLTGLFDTTAVLEQHEMQSVVDIHYEEAAAQWYEEQGSSVYGYTNRSYPLVSEPNRYLTVTYYDGYGYPHASAYPFAPELGHSEELSDVKGLVTGNKSKILDGSGLWLESVTYYDDKYRVIQVQMKNHKMRIDRVTNQYDFVGKVVSSLQTQGDGITLLQEHYYDDAGRLVDTYHTLTGQTRVLLSHNEYNALGELIDKKLHSQDGGVTFAQSTDYQYNIRGWLTEINDCNLTGAETNADPDYFGFEIAYDENWTTIGNVPAYNGNISAVKWTHALGLSPVKERAYSFRYDLLNRLGKAKHHENLGGIWSHVNDFSVDTLTYDGNGNIHSLVRHGKSGTLMDLLNYDYGTAGQKSNQLMSATDQGNTGSGFIDGNTEGHDYLYDKNGNLVKDLNKGIDTIFYNHLNLPMRVEKDVYNYIEYAYDAGGVKLYQTVYEAGKAPKRTDYIGAFVYEKDALQLIQHKEGRIVTDPITGAWEYQYHLKDHLGNVRATFTTRPKTWTFKSNYENDPNNADDMDLFEDVTVSNFEEFNHTTGTYNNASPYTHSQVLRSSPNSQIGSAIVIPVGPGDKITASVFAKYIAADEDPNVLATTLASALVSAFTSGANHPTEHGTSTINNNFGGGSLIGATGFPYEDSNAPRAFLNLMFLPDGEEIELVKDATFAYDQIADGASESVVGDGAKDPFDALRIEDFKAPGPGYVLIYLSNEGSLTDIYFDDMEIEVNEHALIQMDDYYPFGLTFNSYQRENSVPQDYQFSGKEIQNELGLGWNDFGARMYDPTIGRWNALDAYADIYESISPYSYVENNPLVGIDPDGRLVVYVNGFRPGAYFKWAFHPIDSDPIFGVPPPHEWHSPNWYNDDQFNYWGSNFRDSWGFQTTATEADFFVDGSNHAMSTADDRFSKGQIEGQVLAQKLQSGEITLDDGELIKLVGHSMGAAHAMGMAQGLLYGGVDPSLIKVFLFAPHQPNQIRGVHGIEVFQVGRDGDDVSSEGILASATGSKHARVPGSDWLMAPDREDEDHGGHYIQTFTASEFKEAAPHLFQYLIDAGYINPDGSLIEN